MVRIKRSPLPFDITIKCEKDYQSNPVFGIIRDDFFDKCYICEDKSPTSINVEHRVAHKGNDSLKYDYSNLFYSCAHCNGVKNRYFDTVLDCTTVDPEEYIVLEEPSLAEGSVKITVIKNADGVDSTIQLLNLTYNGGRTDIRDAECENLRKHLIKEIISFRKNLSLYRSETDTPIKELFQDKIKNNLQRGSAFAAFKRKIIRDDYNYMREFGEYID
jgi:hypothetical protein